MRESFSAFPKGIHFAMSAPKQIVADVTPEDREEVRKLIQKSFDGGESSFGRLCKQRWTDATVRFEYTQSETLRGFTLSGSGTLSR